MLWFFHNCHLNAFAYLAFPLFPSIYTERLGSLGTCYWFHVCFCFVSKTSVTWRRSPHFSCRLVGSKKPANYQKCFHPEGNPPTPSLLPSPSLMSRFPHPLSHPVMIQELTSMILLSRHHKFSLSISILTSLIWLEQHPRSCEYSHTHTHTHTHIQHY